MGAAKWFLFILLLGTIASILVGTADTQYLGSYASQSPAAPIFAIFGITSSSEAGEMATFGWSSITSVIGCIPSALWWEYSVLTYNPVGRFVQVLLRAMSAGLILSFALMLWSHFPLIGRGSQ